MTTVRVLRVWLVAAALAVSLCARSAVANSGHGEDGEKHPAPGTYYIAIPPEGLYIVDPQVVLIGSGEFLMGTVAGPENGTRKTDFTGGRVFVQLRLITSMQQVPHAPASPMKGAAD